MFNSRFFQAWYWLAGFWKTADVEDVEIIYVPVTLTMPQGAADLEMPQGAADLQLPQGTAETSG